MDDMMKDNKGFSLVELIIVIAIMAILAAALAPQLIKYLENAREASDHQVTESVKTCFNAAIKDDVVYKEVAGHDQTSFDIVFDSDGEPVWPEVDFPELSDEFALSLNDIHEPKSVNATKYTVSWTNNNGELYGVAVVVN